MSERYGFSLTTFSPSGKLVQIEYALNAVNAGSPAVGIKASNGVVLATEKKANHYYMMIERFIRLNQFAKILDLFIVVWVRIIGKKKIVQKKTIEFDLVRLLVQKARKLAQEYMLIYEQNVPPTQLVKRVADVMQEYTQSGFVS